MPVSLDWGEVDSCNLIHMCSLSWAMKEYIYIFISVCMSVSLSLKKWCIFRVSMYFSLLKLQGYSFM